MTLPRCSASSSASWYACDPIDRTRNDVVNFLDSPLRWLTAHVAVAPRKACHRPLTMVPRTARSAYTSLGLKAPSPFRCSSAALCSWQDIQAQRLAVLQRNHEIRQQSAVLREQHAVLVAQHAEFREQAAALASRHGVIPERGGDYQAMLLSLPHHVQTQVRNCSTDRPSTLSNTAFAARCPTDMFSAIKLSRLAGRASTSLLRHRNNTVGRSGCRVA